MFEKFTQKAIDIVQNAQIQAGNLGHDKVYSEHLLLGLSLATKGVQAKLLGVEKVDIDKLISKIIDKIAVKQKPKKGEYIPFSASAKNILEKTIDVAKSFNNNLIMPAHLALAILYSKNSGAYEILKEFDIDEDKTISNLKRLIEKNSSKAVYKHPENEELQSTSSCANIDNIFKETSLYNVIKSAEAKLSTCGYEILGTEQLVQSILENSEYEISKILNNYEINRESFNNLLNQFSSREDEYGARQVIFTPNAFRAMLYSLDCAKEMGSVEVKPEHIILGILKSKTGIAYKIFDNLSDHMINFDEKIAKDLNAHNADIPETLAILRFAKEEAFRLEKNTIGTEMILLGILNYPAGIGSITLNKLGITLKEARYEVEKLIGSGSEALKEGYTYTPRAKKMLECAYETAKRHGKTKIVSEHLLYSIVKQPDCLAMKALEALGTDVLEIKQGILKELDSEVL